MAERADGASAAQFETVVMRYHAEIHRYLHRMTARPNDAEDLSQETFLMAYRAWPRLPPEANHRAWLYTIATNLCRNHGRAEKRRRNAHDAALPTTGASNTSGPEADAVASDTWRLAEAAIRALPVKQRAAFTLRKLHGLDYETIATSLDCSIDSARAHVFQAIRKLRTALDGERPRARRPVR